MSDKKSVLIVEDSFLIAMNLKSEFEAHGWTVIGPSPTSEEAMAYIQTETIDIVCLDYSLETGTTENVAELLGKKNIPFLFLTGDNFDLEKSDIARGKPIMLKPIDMGLLLETAEKLLA